MAARDDSPTSIASTLSNITVHTDKQVAARNSSSSASPPMSTPPTSLGDEASILSDATKMEQVVEAHGQTSTVAATPAALSAAPQPAPDAPNSEGRRSGRNSRKSVPTYNVQILAGTAIHTPTKYLEKHHQNVLHGTIETLATGDAPTPPKKTARKPKTEPADSDDAAEEQLASEAAQAAQRRTSSRVTDLRREAFKNLSGVGEAVANTLSGGRELVQSALRRSSSDSRLRSSTQSTELSSVKRRSTARGAKPEEGDIEEKQPKKIVKPKTKTWLDSGLYAGQHREFDARLKESQNRARRKSKKSSENRALPLPMFSGQRLLEEDPRKKFRDFKLPYDTYHPLRRKVKVDGWTKLNKNRFIGDASALWKRDKQDSSQCYCDPNEGCGDSCHNRIMAYECDSNNCRLTPEQCGNRPFAQLKKRAKGNGYDYGVEVTETEDRGYGVRAMRTFEPHQIIVEYAGEIITQTECERRMKQVYKKDKCYYLMSFDNKMIIDATRGTIARFVNHSCEPNCEMIKWTVSGEPRMALFAGSRGIMTGEELTYDYNFDPFSQKNIQVCRCGTESCRGVLGPKPKKPAETMASAFLSGTKRKIQDFLGTGRGGSESASSSPKKRKIHGNSASAKMKNAAAKSEAERERAEKEAAEQSRQTALRKDRAMKRSTFNMARRSKNMLLRKQPKVARPVIKSSRHVNAKVNLNKLSKPGALKPVKKATYQKAPMPKGKKGLRPNKTQPGTPVRTLSEEDSEEDSSPNITPAALRSANKKVNASNSASKARASFADAIANSTSDDDDKLEVADSEDEEYTAAKAYTKAKGKAKAKGGDPAPRGMHKTGAGVKKPRGGRQRDAKGMFLPRAG